MSTLYKTASVASRALKSAGASASASRHLARATPVVSSKKLARRHASTIPPRSDRFARLTQTHVETLRSFLSSPSSLLSTLDGSATADELASFNSDWLNKYHGKSQVVVKPRSTDEVSKVMKYCYENNIAIVPQGGNTGLVGMSRAEESMGLSGDSPWR
jgi:hypothetical protein